MRTAIKGAIAAGSIVEVVLALEFQIGPCINVAATVSMPAAGSTAPTTATVGHTWAYRRVFALFAAQAPGLASREPALLAAAKLCDCRRAVYRQHCPFSYGENYVASSRLSRRPRLQI